MNSGINTQIRHLPLHSEHVSLGAKIGVFGTWEVPLFYSSILDEHQVVRNFSGLFDISHMGEFLVEGKNALKYLENLVPRAIQPLKVGKAAYTPLLNDAAGFIDDIIIYKCSDQKFIVIVNADNVDKDFKWFQNKLMDSVHLENQTDKFGLLALQGPASINVMKKVFSQTLPQKGYEFVEWEQGMIARTGYTGEDGFEIMIPLEKLQSVWKAIMSAGQEFGVRPCGFGARDTLRLESGMLLYGHDMDESRNPIEAGIEWTVCFDKKYIGSEALMNIKKKGITTQLVGFKMSERGIPRQGYDVQRSGKSVGAVTSGSYSPTFQANLGMAYVQKEYAKNGQSIEIIIRDKPVKAEIVPLPFYKRKK